MKRAFINFGLFIFTMLLKLRYRVTYKGLDIVQEKLKKIKDGALFLPNHPAIIVDPLLIAVPLVKAFNVRPLMVEYMYYNPLFHWAVKTIKALPIPNFTTGVNPLKLKRASKRLHAISEGLKEGGRYLVYPAGMTKRTGKEVVGGAFAVQQLLSENPEVCVVLVRTTGLWGSVFSRAFTHGEPASVAHTARVGIWTLLKNFLFFAPRREITIEFEIAGRDFPVNGSKTDVNKYLEEWYNKPFVEKNGGKEPLKLVSYSFYKDDFLEVPKEKDEHIDDSLISDAVKDEIITKIATLAKQPKELILPEKHLVQDLGLDSLDAAELIAYLEDRFSVLGVLPNDLTTVKKVFYIASGKFESREGEEIDWNVSQWNKKREHSRVYLPQGASIPEVFLKSIDYKYFQVICADARSGVMTALKMKRAILILADKIRKLPSKRIGILLPASSGAEVLVLACQLAGKTPVMINWTVGGRHLDTVVEVAEISSVISSWAFLDNLENVDLTRIEDMLVVVEEIKTEISMFQMFKGAFFALLPSSVLLKMRRFQHLRSAQNNEACVLFTSGTESMPKGVPLTHANILENQRASLEAIELYKDDVLLSILPPFHSFGFSITGLLPLLAGIRVVFYPNPTESRRLSKAIDKWSVTVLCSAPTFIRNIFNACRGSTLATPRLVIGGAEKMPQEVYALVSSVCPHATVSEGYGITECSPVLTVNTTGDRSLGVGKPIPGVHLRIVDPESHVPCVDTTRSGLILASGPNVFSGYLNKQLSSPFVNQDGVRWYNTGDLGYLDSQGNLILAGRYKRFVKIGGEMVSLAAIEEAFGDSLIGKDGVDGVQSAVCPFGEEDGRPKLVLFTTKSYTILEANQTLRGRGFGNLVKIDSVIQLESIPITGTGKVAYQVLQKMV